MWVWACKMDSETWSGYCLGTRWVSHYTPAKEITKLALPIVSSKKRSLHLPLLLNNCSFCIPGLHKMLAICQQMTMKNKQQNLIFISQKHVRFWLSVVGIYWSAHTLACELIFPQKQLKDSINLFEQLCQHGSEKNELESYSNVLITITALIMAGIVIRSDQ